VILDIGCGQGRFSEKIRGINKNIPCYGLDLSPEMIRIATDKALANCHFTLGDSDSLPYEDGSFSKIFSLNAFHHFPDPEKTLRELARIVRGDGEVVIGDVWLPPLLREAVNALLPYTKTGDYRIYSKQEMVELFGRYAFEMTKYFCVYPFLFVAKFRRNSD